MTDLYQQRKWLGEVGHEITEHHWPHHTKLECACGWYWTLNNAWCKAHVAAVVDAHHTRVRYNRSRRTRSRHAALINLTFGHPRPGTNQHPGL